MSENLAEGLQREIERNRELLDLYKSLPGNSGVFGAMFIDRDIKSAIKAATEGDTVEMLKAYRRLEEHK